MIARLNDRDRFPALKEVVVAGHSAGGQLVQRYAVVGRPAARSAGLRFVVSNPSSYLYFSDERPQGDGRFAAPSDAAVCPQYNRWKYGLAGAPPYVRVDPDLDRNTRAGT